MRRIRLAAPAEQELLRRRLAARDGLVGHRLRVSVRDARRARDDGHHLSGEASEVVAGLPVRDLVELSKTPDARESGDLGLRVGRGRAGERRRLVGLGLRHSGLERLVDEETPDLLVGNTPDELFDVDAAVAE
jgi:hypothetical protein